MGLNSFFIVIQNKLMITITRKLLVSYTPEQMYDLVNDVEAYPSFLPWCNGSKIISKSKNVIAASLDLAKCGICHTFSTRNILIKDKSITIEMIDGPFQYLEGYWRFEPFIYGTGCQIQLHINFDFSNRPSASGKRYFKISQAFFRCKK